MSFPAIRLGLLAASACAGAAAAQPVASVLPPARPNFSLEIGAASDGLFRGVSRTGDRAQAFGSVDVAYADVYAGAWASNAAFRQDGPAINGAEVDLYGGWRPEVLGYSLDLGVQYDAFAGQPSGVELNYAEVYAKVSRAVGPVTGRIGLHYAPAFAAHSGPAWYAETEADYALTRDWTLSAGVGRQTGRPTPVGGGDYLTWNAAVARSIGQHVTIGLRYSDTDHHVYGQAWGTRVVAEIRAGF